MVVGGAVSKYGGSLETLTIMLNLLDRYLFETVPSISKKLMSDSF
jgi:hypothetical protein